MAVETETQDVGKFALGYVLIVNAEGKGYIGGYLSADSRGVPIEFRHTVDSPVKTSRIQELVYGNTLKPELLGKHITGALLDGDSEAPVRRPSVLMTEEEAILLGYRGQGLPVLKVVPLSAEHDTDEASSIRRIDTARGEMVAVWNKEDSSEIEQIVPKLTDVDLIEPFERVRALLKELGRGVQE